MMKPHSPSFVALLVSSLPLSLAQSESGCAAVPNVWLTNYGFPDASGLTQFSCNGNQVANANVPTPLGTGEYDNPYSAALSVSATTFKKCETVYIPYFRKYFKFVDGCAQCETDQGAGKLHIDLYLIQSDANIQQSGCETSFGAWGGNTVLRNPPSSLPYEPGALFESGKCYNDPSSGRVFPSDAAKANGCSGGGGGRTTTANPTRGPTTKVPGSTATGTTGTQTGIGSVETGIGTAETAATVVTALSTDQIVPTMPTVPTSVAQTDQAPTAATGTHTWGGWSGGRHRHGPPSRGKRHMDGHLLDSVFGKN